MLSCVDSNNKQDWAVFHVCNTLSFVLPVSLSFGSAAPPSSLSTESCTEASVRDSFYWALEGQAASLLSSVVVSTVALSLPKIGKKLWGKKLRRYNNPNWDDSSLYFDEFFYVSLLLDTVLFIMKFKACHFKDSNKCIYQLVSAVILLSTSVI